MKLEPIFFPSGFHHILVCKHRSKRVGAVFVMLPTSPLVKLPENMFPSGMVTMITPRPVNLIPWDALALVQLTSAGFFLSIYNTYLFCLQ